MKIESTSAPKAMISVTIVAEMRTPKEIAKIVSFFFRPNTQAPRAAVHAPVTGKGMPTNRARPMYPHLEK